MYKPAPQRPKKTSIVRSRSGCKACRQRRVKCDEKKPSCSACVRHGKTCEAVASKYDFRTGIVLANKPHGARYPKRSRVVYMKEMTVDTTVACDEANSPALDDVQDDLIHTSDALARPSQLSSEEDGLSSYQLPTSSALLPLPSPPQRRSLDRTESELFYLTYWEKSCTLSLPRFLGQIVDTANHHAPLMKALLALSACNMSRSLPEGESTTSSSQVTYRPRRECLLSSQHYYGLAVEQVARLIGRNSASSSSHTLMVLVLFCYFESAMGNFASFACHAHGVNTFIHMHFTAISSDPLGRESIAAWILAKNHNWWLRMNFSSFSLQLRQQSLYLSPDISTILLSINARRAVVTSILCESYRISTIALLQLGPCGRHHPELTFEKCIASLQTESKKLDEWHAALPQSELPIESFPRFETLGRGTIRPLLFKTHILAMDYAYYACSRIMQCTTLIRDLQRSHDQPTPTEQPELETKYWMEILLRIVAGLDKHSCLRENVYSIGISSLLTACLLRCHDVAFGAWIENWLYEWTQLATLEEGSFPIAQALETARLVNQEKAAGNDIYAVALPEDDGGGGGKYTSYYSQHFDQLVLIGRRERSRRLYSELIPVRIGG